VQGRLARFIAAEAKAENVVITDARQLLDGAVRENWLVTTEIEGGRLDGCRALVLRTDAATSLGIGHDLAQEATLLGMAHRAGLSVPEPLLLGRDPTVVGKAVYLMRYMPGTAAGERIVAGGANERLARRLGAELARLHAIRPPQAELAFLGAPPADPAAARLADYRRDLDACGEPHPVAEWALRWLAHHKPAPAAPVLCHGDFRTGNYLVEEGRLTAVLDWEFAGWSDPDEDIGWFCSTCWRFGALAREAGGIAPRAAFYRGYEALAGRRVDPARVRYWEVMAALRWLVIALRQRDRFLKAGERSLDLALTGRRPAECELEILLLTAADEAA
jgi:aminoglycoside phosphotransferase (APT) family kinase protein